MSIRRQEALDYHAQGRPGKIQVSPTKPFKNQRDLSLAYTPGVAEPCREIAARPEEAYTYTAKGNLVAVVTNGTAVLGLGNIGPLAGEPVMEGKGILFKAVADIDVFDPEVASEDPDQVVRVCPLLQPTVRGLKLGRHPLPRLFLHRREAARDPLDPRVPRRPARHRDHLGRGAPERVGAGAEGHREGQDRVRRGGGRRHRDRRALRATRRAARAHHYVRPEGRDP